MPAPSAPWPPAHPPILPNPHLLAERIATIPELEETFLRSQNVSRRPPTASYDTIPPPTSSSPPGLGQPLPLALLGRPNFPLSYFGGRGEDGMRRNMTQLAAKMRQIEEGVRGMLDDARTRAAARSRADYQALGQICTVMDQAHGMMLPGEGDDEDHGDDDNPQKRGVDAELSPRDVDIDYAVDETFPIQVPPLPDGLHVKGSLAGLSGNRPVRAPLADGEYDALRLSMHRGIQRALRERRWGERDAGEARIGEGGPERDFRASLRAGPLDLSTRQRGEVRPAQAKQEKAPATTSTHHPFRDAATEVRVALHALGPLTAATEKAKAEADKRMISRTNSRVLAPAASAAAVLKNKSPPKAARAGTLRADLSRADTRVGRERAAMLGGGREEMGSSRDLSSPHRPSQRSPTRREVPPNPLVSNPTTSLTHIDPLHWVKEMVVATDDRLERVDEATDSMEEVGEDLRPDVLTTQTGHGTVEHPDFVSGDAVMLALKAKAKWKGNVRTTKRRTSREDTEALQGWLHEMLNRVALGIDDRRAFGQFNSTAKDAQDQVLHAGAKGVEEVADATLFLYSVAVEELQRQVGTECRERGALLGALWSQFFSVVELRSALKHREEITAAWRAVAEAREENNQIVSELKEVTAEVEAAQENAGDEVEKVKAESRAIAERYVRTRNALEELQASYHEVDERLRHSTKERIQAMERTDKLQVLREELERRLAEEKEKVVIVTGLKEGLESELADARQQIQVRDAELVVRASRIRDLEALVAKRDVEVASLEERYEEERKLREEAQAQLAEFRQKFSNESMHLQLLENEIKELREKLELVTAERDALKAENVRISKVGSTVEDGIKHLRAEMEREREEFNRFRRDLQEKVLEMEVLRDRAISDRDAVLAKFAGMETTIRRTQLTLDGATRRNVQLEEDRKVVKVGLGKLVPLLRGYASDRELIVAADMMPERDWETFGEKGRMQVSMHAVMDALEHMLHGMDESRSQEAELRARADLLARDRDESSTAAFNAREAMERAMADARAAEKNRVRAKKDLDKAHQQLAQAKSQVDSTRAMMSDLKVDILRLKETIRLQERDLERFAQLQHEMDQQLGISLEREKDIQVTLEKFDKAMKDLAEQKALVANLQAELASMTEEWSNMQAYKREAVLTQAKLKGRIRELEDELIPMRANRLNEQAATASTLHRNALLEESLRASQRSLATAQVLLSQLARPPTLTAVLVGEADAALRRQGPRVDLEDAKKFPTTGFPKLRENEILVRAPGQDKWAAYVPFVPEPDTPVQQQMKHDDDLSHMGSHANQRHVPEDQMVLFQDTGMSKYGLEPQGSHGVLRGGNQFEIMGVEAMGVPGVQPATTPPRTPPPGAEESGVRSPFSTPMGSEHHHLGSPRPPGTVGGTSRPGSGLPPRSPTSSRLANARPGSAQPRPSSTRPETPGEMVVTMSTHRQMPPTEAPQAPVAAEGATGEAGTGIAAAAPGGDLVYDVPDGALNLPRPPSAGSRPAPDHAVWEGYNPNAAGARPRPPRPHSALVYSRHASMKLAERTAVALPLTKERRIRDIMAHLQAIGEIPKEVLDVVRPAPKVIRTIDDLVQVEVEEYMNKKHDELEVVTRPTVDAVMSGEILLHLDEEKLHWVVDVAMTNPGTFDPSVWTQGLTSSADLMMPKSEVDALLEVQRQQSRRLAMWSRTALGFLGGVCKGLRRHMRKLQKDNLDLVLLLDETKSDMMELLLAQQKAWHTRSIQLMDQRKDEVTASMNELRDFRSFIARYRQTLARAGRNVMIKDRFLREVLDQPKADVDIQCGITDGDEAAQVLEQIKEAGRPTRTLSKALLLSHVVGVILHRMEVIQAQTLDAEVGIPGAQGLGKVMEQPMMDTVIEYVVRNEIEGIGTAAKSGPDSFSAIFLTSLMLHFSEHPLLELFARLARVHPKEHRNLPPTAWDFVAHVTVLLRRLMGIKWRLLCKEWTRGEAYLPEPVLSDVIGNLYNSDLPNVLDIWRDVVEPVLSHQAERDPQLGRCMGLELFFNALIDRWMIHEVPRPPTLYPRRITLRGVGGAGPRDTQGKSAAAAAVTATTSRDAADSSPARAIRESGVASVGGASLNRLGSIRGRPTGRGEGSKSQVSLEQFGSVESFVSDAEDPNFGVRPRPQGSRGRGNVSGMDAALREGRKRTDDRVKEMGSLGTL